MTTITCIYESLREKLDTLGYDQSLPLSGVPLVSELLDDLVKTTQSLRDLKKEFCDLLEEKACWELGVEPYKCDNARLLKELTALHAQFMENTEKYEEKINEYKNTIRTLQSDKENLVEQNQEMHHQLKTLSKQNSQTKITSKGVAKKPFISTVRPTEKPSTAYLDNACHAFRCTKCNVLKQSNSNTDSKGKGNNTNEVKHLENLLADLKGKLELEQSRVEARDREIRRLCDLLVGGRPPTALAKDCCYKEVASMSDDITRLQREKSEFIQLLDEYQTKMHEAMQRSIDLSKQNQDLRQEMETLKAAAMEVEDVANQELAEQEEEINNLKNQIKKLTSKCESLQKDLNFDGKGDASDCMTNKDLTKRLNEMTQLAMDHKQNNQRLILKIKKQKERIEKLEKEVKEYAQTNSINLDEEKIRLKSERDFFQKEFLRMVSNTGSQKEVEFLRQQIKSKDEELRNLRADLFSNQVTGNASENDGKPASASARSGVSGITCASTTGSSTDQSSARASDCIQAAVLRAERERDCIRAELERIRCERDTLREKHLCLAQLHANEMEKYHLEKEKQNRAIKELELKNAELLSKRLPDETQIVLLKEELEEYKRQLLQLKADHTTLLMRHTQLKAIHEQTHRTLMEDQKRLAVAEEKLLMAEKNAISQNATKDSDKIETIRLAEEIASLKHTYVTIEREKDKLLSQLDAKTERAYQLEYELKLCTEQRKKYENQVKDLEQQLLNLKYQKRECDAELHENSSETDCLRQQICALKASRDKAIEENGRLSNELAESEAEILKLKRKLHDSESEIDRLKKQLRQYVQEVKKAEDLLMEKEKEREEMLEHYRSLSIDAVVLEGNNQSLEFEAAENKRLISELESEIEVLKKELKSRIETIRDLEDKISSLTSKISLLEKQLEECKEEQLVLRVDLNARKELCEKLDVEKEKLNAELNEFEAIRKKLEAENEILRNELEQVDNDYKAASTALEDVLKQTRRDLEEQIKIDSKLNQELLRLRNEKEELLEKLGTEQEKRRHEEILVQEMQVQNQELRQNITDDRFRQARSREASPKMNFS